jgi:hypothetical protein
VGSTYKALDYVINTFVMIPEAGGWVCVGRLKIGNYTLDGLCDRQAVHLPPNQ